MNIAERKYLLMGSVLSAFVLLLVLNTLHYSDYQTNLLPGVYIQNGASDLQANAWSVPLVHDWNGDGKKDLLLGNRDYNKDKVNHGYVTLYVNKGSDHNPKFSGQTLLQSCTSECAPLTVEPDG